MKTWTIGIAIVWIASVAFASFGIGYSTGRKAGVEETRAIQKEAAMKTMERVKEELSKGKEGD